MSDKQDYYAALGVERGVDSAELKKAYRRLAMKYHPDRNPDDPKAEAKFKEIKEAYEVLSDPEKRRVYDQFGHAGFDPGMGRGGPHGGGHAGFGDVFSDIFGDIFGGGMGGNHSASYASDGADLRYNLELSLEEAVLGTTKQIRVPTLVSCPDCGGSGAAKGTSPTTCSDCGGVGQVRIKQGFFSIQQTCPSCRGKGRIISDPCHRCHGHGRTEDTKTLSVKIPAGVDDGDRIRLGGEGQAGMNGGRSGDLYVQVAIKEHAIFSRDGNDLLCEVPISFVVAALGGELDVPTLKGKVKLKIPSETQTGKLFRLRGKGVKSVRSHSQGDLLCRVIVETPVNLNREQKQLLEQLKSSFETGRNHNPKEQSWLEQCKHFFDHLK